MPKYTTILFDADYTLLDFAFAEDTALPEVFRQNGLRTDEEFLTVYKQYNRELWSRYNRGEIEKREITETRFAKLFQHFSIPLDGAEFNEKYIACLANYGKPLPGAESLCRKLFEAGYDLYIITNGSTMVQKNRFHLSGLEPYFKGMFISDEIGIGKPAKAFFDHVFSAIPEKNHDKILVVGDSEPADIDGGINAGLATCLCDFKNASNPTRATFVVKNFKELEDLLLEESK